MPSESPANPEALWKILMQLADPSDILKTILSQSAAHPPAELRASGDQAILLFGCSVTIHQHLTIAGPADRPTLSS